jgi:hypothetical protein
MQSFNISQLNYSLLSNLNQEGEGTIVGAGSP